MQNRLNDILYNTAEEMFENLAFVLTMPEGEGFGDFSFDEDNDPVEELSDPSQEEEIIGTSIHFSGPFEGDLFMEASAELLPVVGLNMMGLDEDDELSSDEQKDAFKELLNVICGNLLPAIAGVKAEFNISCAELHPDTAIPETLNGKKLLASAHFGLEVGHAKLAIFADENICENLETASQDCV